MTRLAATIAALTLGAGLAATAGYLVYERQRQAGDPFADCRQGQTGGADIGGPFTLVDGTGAAVTEADVLTRPTLVYFGYTFCPDVCPLDMARNAEAADILEERGQEVGLVFISIDPERDTPQIAGEFAANIHPRAVGLSGTPEQVKAAADAYRVYFNKQVSDDPEFYLMDHTAFTYLMLPGTGFADFYRNDATGDRIADGAGCFLDRMPAAAG
jgi:protein SCO1